nr:hypothetical protein [Tanacetum cinerariifolium]
MDLFAFIYHSYPTKIRIGERELAECEVKLLKMTEGRIVPLSPPVTNAPEDSGDSIDKLFDDADQEYSVERGDDVLEETIAKDASESLAALHGVVLEGSVIPNGVTEPLIAASVALVSDVRPLDFISSAADALVVTVAVTTTVVADIFAVSGLKARDASNDLENIRDSTSAGGANEDATNISKLNKPSTSVNSFYASQSLDTETMHHIYVPRWKVTNDSILEDPYVCLGAEVRMWAEHTLERKGELEDKFTEHTVRLSERNAKIAHLKSLLSLKESEAAEAIHLHVQLTTVKAADAAKDSELKDLKEKNFFLKGEREMECMEALQDEQAKILGDRVAELDAWLSEMAIHLEENFILASLPPYPDDDGIQDGLKAGIDHGQASKDLSVIEAYDPFAKAKYIDDVNGLGAVDFSLLSELESKKYSCIVQNSLLGASTAVYVEGAGMENPSLMDSLRLDVIGETSLSSCLQVINLRVQRFREEFKEKHLLLTDVITPLVEPLSFKSLTGEASTSADPITTLSTTFVSSYVVLPISFVNDQVFDVEPHNKDHPVVAFEKEELGTSPE